MCTFDFGLMLFYFFISAIRKG